MMRPRSVRTFSLGSFFDGFFLIAVALLGAGCGVFPMMNKTPAPVPQPDWKTLTGQVHYKDAKRSFVADALIRTDETGENFSMEVTKAGARLLKLDRQENICWGRGPLSGLPYAGKIQGAHGNLQRWLLITVLEINPDLPQEKWPNTALARSSDVKITFRLQR